MFPNMHPALISLLLISLSPALSQAAETEEYIDEQWTLNRIFQCPERDMRAAMQADGMMMKKCLFEANNETWQLHLLRKHKP